jgi:hypothetical protein
MGLAIRSIENDIVSVLDYSEILGSFSSRKSRERYFWVSENVFFTD